MTIIYSTDDDKYNVDSAGIIIEKKNKKKFKTKDILFDDLGTEFPELLNEVISKNNL